MIVPAGDAYLELIAVVDAAEAAGVPRSARVARAIAAGRTFAGWAVRCEDLDAERVRLARLGMRLPDPQPGARLRPDGSVIEWLVQELEEPGPETALPFLIAWRSGEHPARAGAAQPAGHLRLGMITLGHPDPEGCASTLRSVLGGGVDFHVARSDRPRILALRVEGARGTTIV